MTGKGRGDETTVTARSAAQLAVTARSAAQLAVTARSAATRQSMPPQTSCHLERRLHVHMLQSIELLLQLRIFGVGGQALGGHVHGELG